MDFESTPLTARAQCLVAWAKQQAMRTLLLISCGSQCAAGHFGASRSCGMRKLTLPLKEQATPRAFEPLRAEPNGFRVHPLDRSGTVSWSWSRYDGYFAYLCW